ncbi:MAG: PKD domain-containing protein [Bacteroides sp.]|nr:PKD domain-containing protein [Bacteroides sp.]
MKKELLLCSLAGILLTGISGCSGNEPWSDSAYTLQKEDIKVDYPEAGFTANAGQAFLIEVKSVSDENVTYAWLIDGKEVAQTKSFTHTFMQAGTYQLTLKVSQGQTSFEFSYTVNVGYAALPETPKDASPYITKVLEYRPAPGQFVNTMPQYKEGDTQATMNEKALNAIGNNTRRMITLGGYGGYVTVGFDHTIRNAKDANDFLVLGNAFENSSEPGIIQVAYDVNQNGQPDEEEWFEIAGSAHHAPKHELWYEQAKQAGNIVETYLDYSITYKKPAKEPTTNEEKENYIFWEDNKGHKGYKVMNQFHPQPYYPQWIEEEQLVFTGTCLPQNGINQGTDKNFVLPSFTYGYADNYPNDAEKAAIDIDWAVDKDGNPANLPGVDFIKIYTGVNQENGWLGENSTEVCGVTDLNLTK